jgi:threonine/homoserine efflux transporter RhtA
MTPVQLVLASAALVVGIWLVVLIVLDRLPGDKVFGALVVLEVGVVVQLVIGLVRVFGDHPGVNVAAYLGYLVGALLVLPIGFVWSAGERTRSGTAVLLVAVLLVPVLSLRLHDLWAAR